MASRAINIYSPLTRPEKGSTRQRFSPSPPIRIHLSRRNLVCSAIQESSTSIVTDKKEEEPATATTAAPPKKEEEPATATTAAPPAKRTPEKPKKAPVKDLPQLIEEDVIPALRATLEAQGDLSQIELSFHDNRLEGSFLKEDIQYIFWAFFPDGTLSGPKGFSLSSYGLDASTVEPFLIDEKRITAKHIVFWVEKRLAAQGIIPVWKE